MRSSEGRACPGPMRLFADDLDQYALGPPAVKFSVENLLQGPKSGLPFVIAQTTSRPITESA